MVELQRMRWYNPKDGTFEWREVPKSDEDALSLLSSSSYTQSCTDTYWYWRRVLAEIGRQHHGGAPASRRASHKRAQLGSGLLTVRFFLRSFAVFFGGLP